MTHRSDEPVLCSRQHKYRQSKRVNALPDDAFGLTGRADLQRTCPSRHVRVVCQLDASRLSRRRHRRCCVGERTRRRRCAARLSLAGRWCEPALQVIGAGQLHAVLLSLDDGHTRLVGSCIESSKLQRRSAEWGKTSWSGSHALESEQSDDDGKHDEE